MRLAAIDIGTTSIHMIVAEVRRGRGFEVVDREKEMVRLGAGGLEGRALTSSAMALAIGTIGRFRRLADSQRVDEIRAVATSAVREARNGGAFLAAIERETGVRARVISGIEEARLIHRAALHGIETGRGPVVVIDIGGGTTEVTLGTRGRIRLLHSLKLGAIRLTERFVTSDPIGRSVERRLVRHIRDVAGPAVAEIREAGFDRVIVTSGTALNIGALALWEEGRDGAADLHHSRVDSRRIHDVRTKIVALDLDHRLRLPGIEPRRADLLVAGAILLDTLIDRLGAEEVTLCDFALREGLVVEYLRRHGHRIAQADRYPDIRRRSVIELAERCGYRVDHARQVARLALELFDQARFAQPVPERAREWLEYAAVLHDVGHHISFDRHHRHSYYLIKNGGLRGFEPAEIEAIALMARHHRRSEPRKSRAPFAALAGPARRAVRAGAAMLRLAESLDRSHSRVIEHVALTDAGREWVLRLEAGADAELERWAASRQLRPLEKVFGKPLRLDAGTESKSEHADDTPSVPRPAVRRRGDRRLRKDDPARAAG